MRKGPPPRPAAALRLRRSRYVSFFRKKDEIYLYHDLWGFILAMDAKVHAFVESFGTGRGRAVADVAREWGGAFRPEEIEGFVGTFRQHRCLVPPGTDEEADAFRAGHPVPAAWTAIYAPQPGVAIVAYKDRALGRIVVDRLEPVAGFLFERADGERTLESIAEEAARALGLAPADAAAEVRRAAFRFTHSDRQVLKLADRPIYEYLSFQPPYLRSTMPFPRIEEAPPPEAPDVVDLAAFHREGIEDAAAQFDVEETTLSHMFREPHPALGGRSYGEAFADALLGRGLMPAGRARVLEVGGGVGFFALRFLRAIGERAPERAAGIRYAILDLSQVLQDSQRMLHYGDARVRFVLANAARGLPIRDGALDLLISNEVVADFTTVRLRRADLEGAAGATGAAPDPTVAEARAFVRRHKIQIDDAPEVFWLNYGALRFVEEVARVLRPGGAAVLVEFGGLARYPIESTHLAHSEFSIHFGHLRRVAENAGLDVEMADIMTFLGMRPNVRVLATTRTYFECLRALLERRGVSLQKIAYAEDDFRRLVEGRLDADALRGLVFKPVGERALGLHPPEFQVAILRKPRRA